jgi:hypothetical protein
MTPKSMLGVERVTQDDPGTQPGIAEAPPVGVSVNAVSSAPTNRVKSRRMLNCIAAAPNVPPQPAKFTKLGLTVTEIVVPSCARDVAGTAMSDTAKMAMYVGRITVTSGFSLLTHNRQLLPDAQQTLCRTGNSLAWIPS